MTSGARRAQGPPYRAQAVREDPALNASVSRLKPARGDRHAHRLASGHTAATKRTRRLPGALSRRRSSGEVSRAGGCGAQPRRRHSRGGTRRATR